LFWEKIFNQIVFLVGATLVVALLIEYPGGYKKEKGQGQTLPLRE